MTDQHNPSNVLRDRLGRIVQASRMGRCVRACLLSTRDRDYALNLLKVTLQTDKVPLYHFTVASRRRYQQEQLGWETMGGEMDVLSLLREAQQLRGGGVVAFEDCVAFLRDEGGDQRVRMLLAQMLSVETLSDGLVLVFIEPPEAEGRLPSILEDQFVRLDVPYPRANELEMLAREEIAKLSHRTGTALPVDGIRSQASQLASGLVGLTRSAARDALRDALARDPADLDGACERLAARKATQLSRELAMNVLDTTDVEEPIGLDNLIEYFNVTRDKMRVNGPGRARGVLLIGPPGTGKTMLARAIGKLVDLPVVEFRISSLMNSLLGETERRFSQAFQTLEAMAPNLVFIDEIEKAFGDSSERDGGTMMRCTGSLLSWLSDNPYPNFIIATSNSLRRMGEIGLTMTRSERFDAAYFVDVPARKARCLMLKRWLSGDLHDSEGVAEEITEKTDKFSGADLRSVVKQAIAWAAYRQKPLSTEMLMAQVQRKRARTLALYDEFRDLREWGLRHCDPAGPVGD